MIGVQMAFQGRIPGTDQWGPIADNPGAEDVPGILIVRIRESLDFGTLSYILSNINEAQSTYQLTPHS